MGRERNLKIFGEFWSGVKWGMGPEVESSIFFGVSGAYHLRKVPRTILHFPLAVRREIIPFITEILIGEFG